MAAGRPSKYYKQVQPFLDKVDEFLNNGATEKQVAEALGVAYSSWSNYKNEFKELKDICDKPRVGLVLNLRGALVKAALGQKVTTKKTYIKKDNEGKEAKYTEIIEKEIPPNINAIYGALNIYDPEYVKDKANYELRREEFELRKELAKDQLWDDNEWNEGEWDE